MARQQLTNFAQSSLAAAYTAGAPTITLQLGDGANFPTIGNFTLAVNNPPTFLLQATSRSGDVISVNATGFDGTTVANALSNTPITLVISALAFIQFLSETSLVGTNANLPSTSIARSGDRYTTIDSPFDYVFDGSVWKVIQKTTVATKGDLQTFSTIPATLSVGTNTYYLVADSTQPTGLNWAAPASTTPFGTYSYVTVSTAGQKVITPGFTSLTANCFVYINGIKQIQSSYVVVTGAGGTVTMNSPLTSGLTIEVTQ
jgi:hypothetical protein